MKISSFIILFNLISLSLSAQDSIDIDPPAKQDTVNLVGVLYTCKGGPASNIIISSSGTFVKNGRVKVDAVTDENGMFTLNGIMTNDTLTIYSTKYNKLHYYNRGSRLLVVYLPPENIMDLNSSNPIEITAKRITPKVIPASEYLPPGKISYHVLQEPGFPGGPQAFLRYINQKLTYPKKAIENNIEGTVEVSFVVGTNGSLNNFTILKGLGYDCEEDLIKILVKSPAWNVGIMNGAPTTSTVSVSVKFSLKDN